MYILDKLLLRNYLTFCLGLVLSKSLSTYSAY